MSKNARIIRNGLLLAALFLFLTVAFPGGAAMEIMNGAITGVGIVIYMTFRHVTFDVLRGRGPYARAQQMALGIAIMWVGANLRTLQSIYFRATNDMAVFDLPIGALVTYLFVIAGVMQATAPGLGKGFLHGQSKTRIASASVIGTVVALGVIWLQRVPI